MNHARLFVLIPFSFFLLTQCETGPDCTADPTDYRCPQVHPFPPAGTTPNQQTACDLPIATEGVDLPVNFQYQECNELCWAAAILMVSEFYNRASSPCQLASVLTQSRYQQPYNCCYSGACYDPYCNQPAQPQEMSGMMTQGFGLKGQFSAQPLSEQQLQIELSNGRPVIVGYQGPFSGHVAVIAGFQPGNPAQYLVYDPWPDFGAFAASYQTIRNGPPPMSPWVMTWSRLSMRNDGCNPNFHSGCGCP